MTPAGSMAVAGFDSAKSAAWRSDGERRAATARRGSVRVANDELRARQVLAVVDLGTHEVLNTHGVDEQRDSGVFDLGIAFLGLFVEGEAVLEPRAPAALHVHPQFQRGVAFLL